MPSLRASRALRHTVFWLFLYTALWWLLSGGAGWYIGIPCVLGAAGLSRWLGSPPWHLRLRELPGFMVFFLGALVSGGWDVARRAIQPRPTLNPAWVHYPLSIPQARYRLLFASMIGLLPGTLAARIDGDHLYMHVLDEKLPWQAGAARLEQQLGKLLGVHT